MIDSREKGRGKEEEGWEVEGGRWGVEGGSGLGGNIGAWIGRCMFLCAFWGSRGPLSEAGFILNVSA